MIKKEEIKNILVTRTDNLGDMILTLPLINEIRRLFPGAGIFFMIKNYTSLLLKDYPGINGLIIADDFKGMSEKIKCFKKNKIDLAINVKPEFDLALAFFLSGIKYRIGTAYRWYSFLYNLKVHEHRKYSVKHESEYNLNLLKTFFDETKIENKFHFSYSEEEKNSINKKISGLLDKKYVIIHPGSRGSARDLPLSKMAEFTDKILKEFPDYEVVLTGTNEDRHSTEFLFRKSENDYKNRLNDLTGRLDLKELMILIDNSKLFVSNSTGPIHIAGALNKNIIGFYPNNKIMSEVRWKPLSSNAVILKPPSGSDDMNEIKPDEFLKSAEKFLKNSGTINLHSS